MPHALRRFVAILCLVYLLAAGMPVQEARAATGPRCYVDSTPSGVGNTGDSWADAYVNLLAALYDANCSEVWVAAGVYKPGALRTLAFIVESGETVYGGFAGTETALSERVPGANLTVLSGDIDNNDVVDGDGITREAADIVGDNSYHVVLMSPSTADMTPATILDGFTITAGNADPNVTSVRDGGGVLCIHIFECSPTLSNLRIVGNAANRGGGLYNAGWLAGFASSPTLINVTFSGNYASFNGGGMYNDGNNGGLSSPTLVNVTFNNNHADSYGGAMYNDGGNDFPAVIYGTSAPDLTNVTISGNTATLGAAGIYNWQEPGFAATNLSNVILWGNSAPSDPEMNNSGVDPNVDHSIIQGSLPGGVWNPVFGTDGGGNQDADPALGPLSDNGGFTPTMALGPRSPAIDRGDNGVCPAEDQRGRDRPWAYNCDVGAYEFYPCFVDDSAGGANDGTTWPDAYNDLQTALGNTACTAVWAAGGIYKPGASEGDYFSPSAGVRLFGGFAGTEELTSERVPGAYPSVLSGDIDNNDTHTNGVVLDYTGISGDNSDHVLFLDGNSTPIDSATIIDGFTITAGQADTNAFPHFVGGGLYCNGFGGQCSPLLRNLTFSGNAALGGGSAHGGALYNQGASGESSPIVDRLTFRGNHADGGGGAMFNSATGGLSSPSLTNVTFSGNSSGGGGGAIYNLANSAGVSNPSLNFVTFSGNSTVGFGGAIYSYGNGGTSLAAVKNSILWGNSGSSGDAIYNDAASTALSYSVVEGGEASIADSDEDPFTNNPANLSESPELGSLSDLGGFSPVIPFAPSGSSALDIAQGGANCLPTDQRGVSRPQGVGCDRGSYELIVEDTVGINGGGTFYLRNENAGGPADNTFGFGWAGPTPLVGDWDGDGATTVGIDDGGWFFLRNSNSAGAADLIYQYGWAGATPLIGDWDGDGVDTVGIYDAGWFFLRNSNSPGPADIVFSFGWAGPTPLVGDWDADGVDTVGIYDAGWFFLRNSNSAGPADVTFNFGWAGPTPMAGDWDGDGVTTVGIDSAGTFFLRNSNSAGPADITFNYGWGGATPLAGTWDLLP